MVLLDIAVRRVANKKPFQSCLNSIVLRTVFIFPLHSLSPAVAELTIQLLDAPCMYNYNPAHPQGQNLHPQLLLHNFTGGQDDQSSLNDIV